MTRMGCLVIAGCLLVCVAGCRGGRSTDRGSSDASAGLVVRRADFSVRLVLTGELQAARAENIVVPSFPGRQTTIRWIEEDGADVVAGQKVLELDTTSLVGDIDAKRLALVKAETELEQKSRAAAAAVSEKRFQVDQRRVELENAQMDATIPQELVSRQRYQEYQLALKRARVAYEKAVEDLATTEKTTEAEVEERRIAVEKARRDVDTSQQAIDTMTVRAPRDGVLVISEFRFQRRKYQVGDMVWVGSNIMQIPDLSSMMIDASLSDVDDGKISAGMATTCTLDTYPDISFPGVVAEIAPVAQEPFQQSLRRAFHVRVDLERCDVQRMRPGMSVKVEIQGKRLKNVLVAPRAAMDFSKNPPVLSLEGGGVVEVRLGPCNAQTCVIEAGAQEGTRLRASR